MDYSQPMYQPAEGAQRLRLLQEHLRANKERYQAGTVRLGKRVTEHAETVNVPVTEERVVLERRPLSGAARPGEIGDGDTEKSIDVPVMGERVNVQKEVTGEEVIARKEQTQRTERVQDTVRHEELVTDGDTNLMTDQTGGREGPRPDGATRGTATDRDYRPEGPNPTDAARRAQDRRP